MNKLPLARSAEIVVQKLGAEILVYDLNTHKAYHLNETSSIVYRACDGKTTFDELKVKTRFTDEIIFLALDEFRQENLLKENQVYNSPLSGMSRREAIRKVGLASTIALPVISSLVAPTAVMAQSGCVNPGGSPSGTVVFRCTAVIGFCAGVCNSFGASCCSGNATATNCTFVPGVVEACDCVCN